MLKYVRAHVLVFLLICVSASLLAQTPSVPTKISTDVEKLLEQGHALRAKFKWEESLVYYKQALEKSIAVNDRRGEADTLYFMGSVYSRLSRSVEALEHYEKALPILRDIGAKALEAATLNNIGFVYSSVGQPQKALGYYEKVATLFRELDEKGPEATTLNNIGLVYAHLGQSQKSLNFLVAALRLRRELKDLRGQALSLSSIGMIYIKTSEPEKALQEFEEALVLLKSIGARDVEAATLSNIGAVYFAIGLLPQALKHHLEALTIEREIGDKVGEAGTMTNIGLIYSNLGQPEKALSLYEQALTRFQDIKHRQGEATTLSNMGALYSTIGQPQKALDRYREALPILQDVGDKDVEGITHLHIGALYVAMSKLQQSKEQLEQALPILHECRDLQNEADVLRELGIVAQNQSDLSAAEQYYKAAITLAERIRNQIGDISEGKVSLLQSQLMSYGLYLNALLFQKKVALAFELAQQTKARVLTDLINNGKIDLIGKLNDDERDDEQIRRTEVRRLHSALLAANAGNRPDGQQQIQAMQIALAKAEVELKLLEDKLYALHPDLQAKRATKVSTLADIGGFLPPDTAMLEYVTLKVTPDIKRVAVDEMVLFVVTVSQGKANVQAFPLNGTAKQWSERNYDFIAACSDANAGYEEKAANLASQLLPAKARALLAGKKRLIVCPDGPLWGLPFQALRTPDGKFWLQQYEIDYAYSATGAEAAFKAKQSKDRPVPSHTLFAIANPDFGGENRFEAKTPLPLFAITEPAARPLTAESKRPLIAESKRPLIAESKRSPITQRGGIAPLPGTEMEADALKKDFPGSQPDVMILTGKQAQKEKALQEMSKYRYLHFATHGWFSDTSPMMSCVILAEPSNESKQGGEEGFLTARDIFDLNLSADMVVLSACNTARGSNQSGEGMVGLTWALFAAGAPTQVVSQWSVADESTARLMQSFYANLIQRKMPKGAALRQAALSLQKDGKHSHPYYWAPFILMGDWR